MTAVVTLYKRRLANAARYPYFILISLIQPLAWLLLFGSLFSGLKLLPVFAGQSYIGFIAPGIAVMSAAFGASYSGIDALTDIKHGLVEKLFASPASLVSISLAPQMLTATIAAIQAAAIVVLGAVMKVYPAGGGGLLGIMAISFLLGLGFSGISNAIATFTKEVTAVMGIMNFISLPLIFTSSMLMKQSAMPPWMQATSRYNPVEWAVETARAFYDAGPYPMQFWGDAVGLILFAVAGCVLSVIALRSYKASL